MIVTIILFSFYLEGIISRIINIDFLIPLFTIVSLIIIYPYLYFYKKDYYKLCFFTGLLYDIAYTDTIFLNATIFLLLGFIIVKINTIMTNNIFNLLIFTILIISIYRVITYMILIFINYIDPNIFQLLRSIIQSLLINIIYVIFLYKTVDVIANKKGIFKVK